MLKESVIIDYLLQIFPEAFPKEFSIERVGGMSNFNYKVAFHGRTYVLRIPGNGADGMVERENEELNSMLAQNMGIHPSIAYFNRKTGIKLVDYIEQAETLTSTSIQKEENLQKIAAIYRTLHSSRVRERNDFNIFHEIDKYNYLMEKSGAKMYGKDNDTYFRVTKLENELNSMGVELKPCHNDGVPENFIKDKWGKIYLIDWEYSGMNDPVAELAALFLESEFSKDSQDIVLKNYFEDKIPSDIQLRLLIYQILWDYLWAQWTVIKEAMGDDFGGYGRMRYERAMNNLQLL
ncbi:MAG: phosphotransferase family protein [Paludibacteraceae bacterium]|nr:phosphotransferase family protein [Paludibacteraceae bacterium]